MSLIRKLKAYRALGMRSVGRVALYRAALKARLHPVQWLGEQDYVTGPFFAGKPRAGDWPVHDERWNGSTIRFDWLIEPLPPSGIPDWLANPFGAHGADQADQPWWTISDFGQGDIKGLWELSRFSWLPVLAQGAVRGDKRAQLNLNLWLGDWAMTNPPWRGPNWKCGQEASIRVLHMVAAALILDEHLRCQPALLALIEQHLRRIAPTMGYAIGQDNNHGTSEAAALFVGGSLLAAHGHERGAQWTEQGRIWLEERARTLIGPDGNFSQYSVNYHRVMLDTYAFAEVWRLRLGLPGWSPRTRERLRAAAHWLRALVDPVNGDAPNIGASDGARLLPLTASGYRDFRPSVQLATILFERSRAFNAGPWDEPLQWLGVPLPDELAPAPVSQSFDLGGWHVLQAGPARLTMRYPRFRFRPSQSDALHVDLSVAGTNWLRDAGTYSYNAPDRPDGDFGATRFHNSVSFDGDDQMPKVSRFLFGEWLHAERVERAGADDAAAAGYTDSKGRRHWRRVQLSDAGFTCMDELGGGFGSAALRWRLPKGDWELTDNGVAGQGFALHFASDGPPLRIALVDGEEARDYHRLQPVTVVEVSVDQPCTLTTSGSF